MLTWFKKVSVFMHVLVQSIHGQSWYFTPIYANPNLDNMRVLWDDLKDISRSTRDP